MNYKKINFDEYPNSVVENAEIIDKYKEVAKKMSESAAREFAEHLTQIPRLSGDCEAITKYLCDWAREHGLEPHIDKSGCVYWDVPATSGFEKNPKVILQAHMDIVWESTDPNITYPSPIDLVYEEDRKCFHSRDYKTTIGADDAEGIMAIMEISMSKDIVHGPLRALFTIDEETTIAGAENLSPEVLDANYLLNLDSRQIGVIIIACSGFYDCIFEKQFDMEQANLDTHLSIKVDNLLGGHSGNNIVLRRVNALDVLKNTLSEATQEGIEYEISSLTGGINKTSIPCISCLNVCVDKSNVERIKVLAKKNLDVLMENSVDDKNGRVSFEILDMPDKVFNSETSKEIINIFMQLKCKYYDVMDINPQVARTSTNYGVVKIEDSKLWIPYRYRYTDPNDYLILTEWIKNFAHDNNLELTNIRYVPSWVPAKNKTLNNALIDAFRKSIGIDPIISATHGCNECGMFVAKHPGIMMAAFGADVQGEHTAHETLYMGSFAAHMASILCFLEDFNVEIEKNW